jgi:hypothetical protein
MDEQPGLFSFRQAATFGDGLELRTVFRRWSLAAVQLYAPAAFCITEHMHDPSHDDCPPSAGATQDHRQVVSHMRTCQERTTCHHQGTGVRGPAE